MAIQKSKTLPNGASGNYWRITKIVIDRQNLQIAGSIALFKDAATSAAGSPPLGGTKTFNFPLDLTAFLATPNAIAFMYTMIADHAAQTLDYDINGAPLDPPRYREPDLVGGIMV